MTATLYHNPRCSKSRAALALLEARGVQPRIVAYLDDPPTVATLDALARKLGVEPREMLRRDEPEYAALGLDDPALTRTQLLETVHRHPRLLQRPILELADRARIGRPPEAMLEIL